MIASDLALSSSGRQRFVERACGYETPCWIWQMAIAPNGYGIAYTGGYEGNAHRFVYTRLVGPVPEGAVLDHLCKQRSCVNPAHLQPVSQAENVRRGRLARLTQADVDRMREGFAAGDSDRSLAERFGVSRKHVADIRRGRRWAAPGGAIAA